MTQTPKKRKSSTVVARKKSPAKAPALPPNPFVHEILEYVGKQKSKVAKVEALNPGHSNKDRIALYIIESAEEKGLIKPGSTIIETTSGNTGFSLAMVSVIKGYNCVLAVSSKPSPDKIDMLKAMGAKVYVCPAHVSADDSRSYYQVAKRLHEEIKGSFYINQYFNKLNID